MVLLPQGLGASSNREQSKATLGVANCTVRGWAQPICRALLFWPLVVLAPYLLSEGGEASIVYYLKRHRVRRFFGQRGPVSGRLD